MCSDQDCRIFRGMIQACDECRKHVNSGYKREYLEMQGPQGPSGT